MIICMFFFQLFSYSENSDSILSASDILIDSDEAKSLLHQISEHIKERIAKYAPKNANTSLYFKDEKERKLYEKKECKPIIFKNQRILVHKDDSSLLLDPYNPIINYKTRFFTIYQFNQVTNLLVKIYIKYLDILHTQDIEKNKYILSIADIIYNFLTFWDMRDNIADGNINYWYIIFIGIFEQIKIKDIDISAFIDESIQFSLPSVFLLFYNNDLISEGERHRQFNTKRMSILYRYLNNNTDKINIDLLYYKYNVCTLIYFIIKSFDDLTPDKFNSFIISLKNMLYNNENITQEDILKIKNLVYQIQNNNIENISL